MTEQEAQVYEVRMSKVWTPFKQVVSRFGNDKLKTFGVMVTEEVALYVDVYDSSDEPSFEMRGPGHNSRAAGLCYEEEEIYNRLDPSQEQEEFTDKWLSYFRRGLWLSGCDIEATAHEKAEWMQGFSQEELEAWNLKI